MHRQEQRISHWTNRAIIYGLNVFTFNDSDGDGIGDFKGLTQRLPYLIELGVTCLWLLPFYPSPRRDNGYDVIAHDAIDPRCGSWDDFDQFVTACRRADIRLLIDLVVNHTSDEHPWFKAAEADRRSPYRNYYIWVDDPSKMPHRQPAFPGEVSTVWTYSERAKQFYFHNFYPFQPELNMANAAVRDEIVRIMRFWLDKGVDGFRLDSAGLLFDRKGPVYIDDQQRLLSELHRTVHSINPSAVLLGETDVPMDQYRQFYNGGHGIDFFLNFPLPQYLFLALAQQTAEPLVTALNSLSHCFDQSSQCIDQSRWAMFLRNLDELNIGRLSQREQQQVFAAFGDEDRMQIYGRGIRRRLAPMFKGDGDRLLLAWSLLFTLPGIPLLVYGDEIGMGDCLELQGRNAVRTPMQWSAEPNAGFSSAPADKLVAPIIQEGAFDYRKVNVEAALSERGSLLQRIRAMIAIRRASPALGRGHHVYEMHMKNVLILKVEQGRELFLALYNLGTDDRSVEVTVDNVDYLQDAFDAGICLRASGGTIHVSLPRYGFRWLHGTGVMV